MRGHQLQNEREAHENATAPPARFGEQRACLTDTDELIRRALSAEIRGDATALPALEQDGGDEDNSVDDKNCEEQIENHLDS